MWHTRCAVSSNRSLSIASSSRGATTLSPARPKRLFGSVGGRPAPARWRGSGRLQKRSVEYASHRRGPTRDSAILSELARCYCLHTARAQAACQGVDRQLTKTTGLHRTMAKVCKSDGQETSAGTQGNGEVAPIPDLRSLAPERQGSLRVFGRLPVTGARACMEAGVRKASREETAGGVCVGGAVGLWGFSARV